MLDYLAKAKDYLWALVEIGFLTVLTVILIYLILGTNSGVFVSGVADNVLKFANAIPAQSLVGIAIVLALVFLIARRAGPGSSAGPDGSAGAG
jgi:nitrate reductase gamma subunit